MEVLLMLACIQGLLVGWSGRSLLTIYGKAEFLAYAVGFMVGLWLQRGA